MGESVGEEVEGQNDDNHGHNDQDSEGEDGNHHLGVDGSVLGGGGGGGGGGVLLGG